MKPKILRFLAGLARGISYILVFYVGLAIGVSSPETGISPMVAFLFAVLFGSAASATTTIAIDIENDTITYDSRPRNSER